MDLIEQLTYRPVPSCTFKKMLDALPDDERQAVEDYVEHLRNKASKFDSFKGSRAILYNVLKNNGYLVGKNQIRIHIDNECSCRNSS